MQSRINININQYKNEEPLQTRSLYQLDQRRNNQKCEARQVLCNV